MNPRRMTHAASPKSPVKIARSAASDAYREGSPAANGARVAAVSRAVVDSGPGLSRREVPMKKYTTSASTITQSPICAGTPARAE